MTNAALIPIVSATVAVRPTNRPRYASCRFEFPTWLCLKFLLIYCPIFIAIVILDLALSSHPAEVAARSERMENYRQSISAAMNADFNAVLDGSISPTEFSQRNAIRFADRNPIFTRTVQESPRTFFFRMVLLWSVIGSAAFFGALFLFSVGSNLLGNYLAANYYRSYFRSSARAYS